MNSNDESKLNMYRTVENVGDANIAIITSIVAFLTAFTKLKTVIADIIITASEESLQLSGITIDKSLAKKNLCKTASNMGALIFAFANTTSDNTLQKQVNFSVTTLTRLKDDLLVPTVKKILDAAVANAAALVNFGVTPASIAALQASMDAYSTAVPKPRSAKATKEMFGKKIKRLIKDADSILKTQMDKFVANLGTANQDFVDTYKAARVIVDPTTSTTQIKGNISSEVADAPAVTATVQIIGLTTVEVLTNASGNYSQKPLIPGIYQLTILAKGFEDKTITGVEVKLGKTTTLDIKLKPKP